MAPSFSWLNLGERATSPWRLGFFFTQISEVFAKFEINGVSQRKISKKILKEKFPNKDILETTVSVSVD